MREQVACLLACPVCGEPLALEGKKTAGRLVNGCLSCVGGHVYQVKEEIGLLKDAKLSENEFEWKVDVADEKKYDAIRRGYDSYLREDQKAATRKAVRTLVDLAISCDESGSPILDVATGMGTFMLQLAKQSPRNQLIIGTDIDEKPLRGAMNRAKKARTWHKLSLIVTDAKHLCFRSGSFLRISSYFGFDNVPLAALVFNEAARVLRVGGRVFFCSLWLNEDSESMSLAEKYDVGQIASENRLRNVLSEAGLTIEHLEEVYSGVWPRNPMDLLPVEGDEYSHVVVQAKKE